LVESRLQTTTDDAATQPLFVVVVVADLSEFTGRFSAPGPGQIQSR
jgi:hypothetical protein